MEEAVNKSQLVAIRDGIGSDHAFIYSSWLKGLRYGNDDFERMDSTAYFKHFHNVLESILDDFSVTVRIACLKEDPDVILGFSVLKDKHLFWVFVKARWRGIGLATDLVPADIQSVSHVTKVGVSLLKKHPSITINPYYQE